MKVIIDEAGEIIAKAADDHTLMGDPPSSHAGGQPGQESLLARYRRTREA